jgi:DNA polymerase-4
MILHVDMDAFYASVEIRDRPELMGQPVVVGGTPQGRGVVAAASYEARRFGVHSAMPAATALRLCPQAVFLSPRMQHYAEVSEQLRRIFDRFTPLVEPLSLDEAFLDVTGSEAIYGPSIEIGRQIKAAIRSELDLIASVGAAPNKFLAKVASDLEKPDGFVVVDPDRIQDFLDPLPIRRLWGVGRVTGKVLARLGIRTIRDVRLLSEDLLTQQLGEPGQQLWRLAHGLDERPVVPYRQAKSISHETTFAADIGRHDIQRAWVVELAEQVAWRLRRSGLSGRTVTRAKSLANATNVTAEIADAAIEMLTDRIATAEPQAVRLLGVGVSGFDRSAQRQLTLFDESEHGAAQQLDAAADEIRRRFGRDSLTRGSSLLHQTKHEPQPRANEPRDR